MRSPFIPDAPFPTYESLLAHYDSFGLADEKIGYRKERIPYRSYTALAKDSLVEVAIDYLTAAEYADFIAIVGDPSWREEAINDWVTEHPEGESDAEEAARAGLSDRGSRSQRRSRGRVDRTRGRHDPRLDQ